jgi:site-specific DNA-methyltransferase (adenine-specific)
LSKQKEIIGNGVIHFGDAIEMMRGLEPASVDMVFTDPPYRTISGGKKPAEGFGWHVSVLKENDGKIFAHNDVDRFAYLSEMFRVMKDGSHAYVMTNNLNLKDSLIDADRVGFGFHNLLVWRKNTCTANRWYMKEMELVLFLYKRPAKKINDPGSKQIFESSNIRDKIHPTQKPVDLISHYIKNSSNPGDAVLDPFAGSGSTAVAAELTGRKWITSEIDPEFYEVAVNNIRSNCVGWDLV